MALDTFNADASDEQKGTGASTTGTVLEAKEAADLSISSQAHVYFDVMDTIGAGTITAATLKYYSIGYSKSGIKPATSEQGNIEIYTGSGWYEFYQFTSYPGDGLRSHALDATALGHIGSRGGGVYDTEFRWTVDDPGSSRSRTWQIAAYENTSYTEAYLEVTYTPAGGGTPRTVIISV